MATILKSNSPIAQAFWELSIEKLKELANEQVERLFANQQELIPMYKEHYSNKTKLGLVKFLHKAKFYEELGKDMSALLTFIGVR